MFLPNLKIKAPFARSRKGNVATTAAVLALPMLLAVGTAVDYSMAFNSKSDMQEASDAAALAAAEAGNRGKSDAEQKQIARDLFNEICDTKACGLLKSFNVEIKNDTVTVNALADTPLSFMHLADTSSFPVEVESQAAFGQSAQAQNIHVTFMADMSGSMSIAEGEDAILRMQSLFRYKPAPKGCAFACHRGGSDGHYLMEINGMNGYELARANSIPLREDRVREEIGRIGSRILDSGVENASVSIKTFEWNATDLANGITKVDDLKAYISDVEGTDGVTNISLAFDKLLPGLAETGNGTKGNPIQVMVLITDGVVYSTSNPHVPLPINPKICNRIKKKGYELFVMNVKYPDPDLIDDGVTPKVKTVRSFINKLPHRLRNCASNGRYFEAAYGTDLTNAFDDLLEGLADIKTAKAPVLVR